MKEKSNFLVFLSFFFVSFLIMFLSFPPFSISSLSFFVLFNRNQYLFFHCFFFYQIMLLSSSRLFLFVILFFLLLSLCLVLFNSFSHLSLQTFFLFHSFEISFSFPFYLSLFCVFHFSKLLFRFCFIPFF